jgi:hypothetical protein
MGYLRFKLRRSRCRAAIRAAYRRSLPPELMQWVRATPQPPRGPGTRFLRLATDQQHPVSGEPQGIFAAAYELRDSGDLFPEQRRRLRDLLRWFGTNLAAPKRVPRRAIFWIRSDASDYVAKLWELVHVLHAAGIVVTMMHTDEPGQIEYRDDLQVAAIPYFDRRPEPRRVRSSIST